MKIIDLSNMLQHFAKWACQSTEMEQRVYGEKRKTIGCCLPVSGGRLHCASRSI